MSVPPSLPSPLFSLHFPTPSHFLTTDMLQGHNSKNQVCENQISGVCNPDCNNQHCNLLYMEISVCHDLCLDALRVRPQLSIFNRLTPGCLSVYVYIRPLNPQPLSGNVKQCLYVCGRHKNLIVSQLLSLQKQEFITLCHTYLHQLEKGQLGSFHQLSRRAIPNFKHTSATEQCGTGVNTASLTILTTLELVQYHPLSKLHIVKMAVDDETQSHTHNTVLPVPLLSPQLS